MKDVFNAVSIQTKSILACILGLILILGTLGKLQILQGILNFIIISVGLALILWGIHCNRGFCTIKDLMKKNNNDISPKK